MTIFEKNEYLLATIAAGLALGHVSNVSSANGEFSPMASFVSAENCDYSVDYEVENILVGPGGPA